MSRKFLRLNFIFVSFNFCVRSYRYETIEEDSIGHYGMHNHTCINAFDTSCGRR